MLPSCVGAWEAADATQLMRSRSHKVSVHVVIVQSEVLSARWRSNLCQTAGDWPALVSLE
jgi:hypothetical protein